LTYKIKLPVFEGAFDLLLFFIERDELDIYDIPIAQITNDFLAYITDLERLNIDVASEFILVAATLMSIKARMLLPRPVLDETGQEIDPRQELVNKLLEHKRLRAAVEELQQLENQRSQRIERGNTIDELQTIANLVMADAELENLTLYKLLKAYEQVLARFKLQNEKVIHTVVNFNYSMEERHIFLLEFVSQHRRVHFKSIFDTCENKIHAIFTFLALLELLQQEKLLVVVGQDYNDFDVLINFL
jgi:segregation and condensation protein A